MVVYWDLAALVNGRDLGRQLVAVSPDIYGDSGFQGVWLSLIHIFWTWYCKSRRT